MSSFIPNWSRNSAWELLGARLLGSVSAGGREVVHLVAKRLVDLSSWLGRLETVSRDFH
jgi:error-prone DNA polymerase